MGTSIIFYAHIYLSVLMHGSYDWSDREQTKGIVACKNSSPGIEE
jgi:hypothetical protein